MNNYATMPLLLGTLLISVSIPGYSQAQPDNAPRGAMVHVVITDMAVQDNNELPQLMKDDVKVNKAKPCTPLHNSFPHGTRQPGFN